MLPIILQAEVLVAELPRIGVNTICLFSVQLKNTDTMVV